MSCSAVEKQAQYIALNQSSLALAITLPNFVPRLSCSLSRGKGAKRERAWFQLFAHARNFPRNLRNRVILVFFRVWITHNCVISVFFRVMAICSDDEFSSALVLRIIYTDKGYSDWKVGRNDRVVIVLLLLHDAAQ